MGLVPERSAPTSVSAVKSGAKSSIRTSFGIMWLVLGVGLFFMALPYLSRLPIVGGLIQSGTSILPGRASQSGFAVNRYGRRMG